MSEGKRPGGLTALAVINFVFGFFNVLGFLGLGVLLAFIGMAADEASTAQEENMREAAKVWEELGMGLFYFILISYFASAFLLIASGVGYIKQHKFWGRTMGNAYAILAIAFLLVMGLMVSEKADGGFSLGTIVMLVYPALTLLLLNGTFKHDFTR